MIADASPGKTPTVWLRAIATLTAAVVLGTMTLQALEIRQLRASVVEWRRRAQWPAVDVGFPPLTVQTLDGSTRTVGSGPSRGQVIAVFTTSCPYCLANQPAWKALASRLDSLGDVDMVWLSLSPRDSTANYASEQQLPENRLVLEANKALLRAARIRGVPLTLVVDAGSIIRYVHVGALTSMQLDSIVLAARAPRAVGTTASQPLSR